MSRNMKLALAAVLGIAMLGGAPTIAHAQTDPGQTIISSLDLDSVDVREALRALFKNVGVSYSIAPEVQGTVTVNLRNVTFEAAIQNILKQVDATYRIEGGVYQIIHREDPIVTSGPQDTGPTTTTGNKTRRKIYVRHADPQFLAILIGQQNGNQSYNLHPEVSTVANTPNGGGGQGGQGQGGFGGSGLGGSGGGGGGLGGSSGGGGFGGGGGGRGGGGGGGFGGGLGG